jgi:O-antigen/teichoic acid export membrane protein
MEKGMGKSERIAKNTLMLYFRQIVIMLVSLYTVRVVLEILGVEDYGIYNIVGGMVVIFNFLNNAMTLSTQRYLNFAMGQNDIEQIKKVFSSSIIIHVIIAGVIFFLAQTIGLWFFFNIIDIPQERQTAALFVFQLSLIATMINIIRVPYKATIFAYEKMSFFAMLSIVEAVLRLGIVFLLPLINYDQLIVYAFLVLITTILIFLVFMIYCKKTFETAHFRYHKDKKLFKELLGFSGWNLFGGVANAGKKHGLNILVNVFHGVTVNAAIGIATNVNAAVFHFISNFKIAFKPQIIKSYSAGDYDYFMRLIFRTSKISFFLLFLFVLPLYINAGFVLHIWLTNIPEYAVVFTQLILLTSLVDAIIGPLGISIQATGDIKMYQIIISCFYFAILPLSFLFLLLGFSPVWILIIQLVLNFFSLIWRIFYLGIKINLPVKSFFLEVMFPLTIISGISCFFTIMSLYISDNNWIRLITSCFVSTICTCCLVYLIGINKSERIVINNWVKKKLFRTTAVQKGN